MSYEEISAKTFSIYSENWALNDTTATYKLIAELAAYPKSTNPTAPQESVTATVKYLDPCLTLTTLTATT